MRTALWSFLGLAGSIAVTATRSPDGTCGGSNGYTCVGSKFGNCCGADGQCGSTAPFCVEGCQFRHGYCAKTKGQPSPDGTCGGSTGYTCEGTNFGNCCSKYGFCGQSGEHCGSNCDNTFGRCGTQSMLLRRDNTTNACPAPVIVTHTVTVDPTYTATATSRPSSPVTGNGTVITNATASSITATGTSSCAVKPTKTPKCVPCEGQPGKDPKKWCGLDINTNWYKEIPKTCRTVYYTLEVTNTTIKPDGIERQALLINGTMPGPTLEANWGDTVVVTVINKMQSNGTSIHFHGIRQNYTNEMDGVPSITQCPIAPGDQLTYTWVASQYGTSWYHSHFAIQTWEGVFGPLVIHGPSSQEYDVDAGTVMVQDWSHATVDSMYDAAQDAVTGGPRTMDNGLINGKNTWGADGTANQTGSRFELEFEEGKSYLLRIVNAAIQSTYKFYLDGHTMTVISTDFVPIVPYETDILNINIGQRYNVIVKANQPIGNYWLRADNQNTCATTTQATDIKGIVRYSGSSEDVPTSTAYEYTGECVDEPLSKLVPVLALDATTSDLSLDKNITVAPDSANLFKWYLSGTTFQSQWGDPTLLHILETGEQPSYSGNLIIDVPNEKEWVYVIIESGIPLPHPIHLHGHDFHILAEGAGSYDSSVVLNLVNPPRRDTALMPGAGFLVLAFETDNPGAWLMHCHIGWHTSMGFALQFVEMQSQIKQTVSNTCVMQDTCAKWNAYASANGVVVNDSGV